MSMSASESVVSRVRRLAVQYDTAYNLQSKLNTLARLMVCSFFFNQVYSKLEIWYFYRQPFPWFHIVLLPATILTALDKFTVPAALVITAVAGIDGALIFYKQLAVWATHGQLYINELMVKKFSLLGASGLILAQRYKPKEAIPRVAGLLQATTDVMGKQKSAFMLAGRLLLSTLFVYVGATEINRQLNPIVDSAGRVYRRPAGDGHDYMWYKLLEFVLSLPFIVGFKTRSVAIALASVLVLEALTAWAWWSSHLNIGYIIHAREHFCVNIAVAGGLILLCFVGAGRYTVDELLKKRE